MSRGTGLSTEDSLVQRIRESSTDATVEFDVLRLRGRPAMVAMSLGDGRGRLVNSDAGHLHAGAWPGPSSCVLASSRVCAIWGRSGCRSRRGRQGLWSAWSVGDVYKLDSPTLQACKSSRALERDQGRELEPRRVGLSMKRRRYS